MQPQAQVFLAAEDSFDEMTVPRLRLKSQETRVERLIDRRPSVVDPLVAASRRNGYAYPCFGPSAWTVDDIPTPNITDKDTVLNLALIAANALRWRTTRAPTGRGCPPLRAGGELRLGTDSLPGHVWADEGNSTIIIGLKGTSTALLRRRWDDDQRQGQRQPVL